MNIFSGFSLSVCIFGVLSSSLFLFVGLCVLCVSFFSFFLSVYPSLSLYVCFCVCLYLFVHKNLSFFLSLSLPFISLSLYLLFSILPLLSPSLHLPPPLLSITLSPLSIQTKAPNAKIRTKNLVIFSAEEVMEAG